MNEDIAWLAGILDGEGHIGIAINKRLIEHNTMMKTLRFRPRIMVLIFDRDGSWRRKMASILNNLDVKYNTYIRKNNSAAITIIIGSRNGVEKIINAVYPHVTIKKNHLNIIRDFLDIEPLMGHAAWTNNREMIEKKAILVEKLRSINFHKGKIKWTRDEIMKYWDAGTH